MIEYVKLNVGQELFRVSDQRRFEVTKVDKKGAYLCCFDGKSSELIFIGKNTVLSSFDDKFKPNLRQAYKKAVENAELDAKKMRNFYNNYIIPTSTAA